jgi:hypothetical protein
MAVQFPLISSNHQSGSMNPDCEDYIIQVIEKVSLHF